jgi:integrase
LLPAVVLARIYLQKAQDALGDADEPDSGEGSRKALARAAVRPGFRPWHGLRHSCLTETAAAGVPAMFVQAKAGHAQGSTTERYLHANRTAYPDGAELAEARLFGGAFGNA